MIAVKALGEGTNVPNCEIAIICAGSGVKRQMIQRLGRILRIHKGKSKAKVYQLYVNDTVDFRWLEKRNSMISKNANLIRWI